jgi:hypothetical protein
MIKLRYIFWLAIASLSLLPHLQAQTSTPVSTAEPPSQPKHVRREPCWEEAGIPRSALQQRKQIEQATRSQVQSVCNDSSLSAQQKKEKTRELREQERKQIEGLITSQQMQALKACREERGGGGHTGLGRGGPHHNSSGSCGEVLPGKSAASEEESKPEQQ